MLRRSRLLFVQWALLALVGVACSSVEDAPGVANGGSGGSAASKGGSGGAEKTSGGSNASSTPEEGGSADTQASTKRAAGGSTNTQISTTRAADPAGGTGLNAGGTRGTTMSTQSAQGGAQVGSSGKGNSGASGTTSARGASGGMGGGSSGSSGSSATNTSSPSSETKSSGCGKAKPAQVPTSVDVAGTERTFLVDVPASYDENSPTPLLIAFHGMSITAKLFRSFDNLNSAFASSYIIVRPNALGDPTQWDSTGTKDFAFFDALLELIEQTYCIDKGRVFLTGHSSGGYFTNSVACLRGTLIRGVAPQSGAGPLQQNKCTAKVAAVIFHGQSDPSVLPAEGVKSRDYWGKAAGCNMSLSTTSSLNAVCVEYAECDAEHPLVYCPYDGDHNLWKETPKVMFDFFAKL